MNQQHLFSCFQCDQSVGVESELEPRWFVCFAREAAQQEAARRIVVSLTLFTYAKPSHGIRLESPGALSNSSRFGLRIQELFNLGIMMQYYTVKTQTNKVYLCFRCFFLFFFGHNVPYSTFPLTALCVDQFGLALHAGSPSLKSFFSSPPNVSGHSVLAERLIEEEIPVWD